MPGIVDRCRDAAARGVVLLALDGLSYGVAEQTLVHARIRPLLSTFPSTSTTAWLTAVTGLEAGEHGAVGMVYRAPGADAVTHLVSGSRYRFGDAVAGDRGAGRLVLGGPTLFERCAESEQNRAVVVGAELEGLSGEWAEALLRGADVVPSAPGPLTDDPVEVVRRAIRDVGARLLAEPPSLVWAYVNLDDHIHRFGYDRRLREAVRLLDLAACGWAEAGWSVLAHADHGQTPVTPRTELIDAWARLDSPAHCLLPAGGAGRVRWMYPRPGHRRRLAEELRQALAGHALVLSPEDLDAQGLLAATPVVLERIGAVVAVAASSCFPVPDPGLAWEHGARSEDELLVPLAAWGADPWPEQTPSSPPPAALPDRPRPSSDEETA
ncbi:alkaline phosphatase family protein [Streptacidiphilus sp. N1-10]|uniref:Alkaline phosphatase family protein n=1 Tax=Streptacidiphilus jeojiensis TaxID=3229225 RepID=A0ABV6XWG6_9ACTN